MKFGVAWVALAATMAAADNVSVNPNQSKIWDAVPQDLVAAGSYFPESFIRALMLGDGALPTNAADALALASNMPDEEKAKVSPLYEQFIKDAGSLLPTPTETTSSSTSSSESSPTTTSDPESSDSDASDDSSEELTDDSESEDSSNSDDSSDESEDSSSGDDESSDDSLDSEESSEESSKESSEGSEEDSEEDSEDSSDGNDEDGDDTTSGAGTMRSLSAVAAALAVAAFI